MTPDIAPVDIVGAGLAGLATALAVADSRPVVVLAKRALGEAATAWAPAWLMSAIETTAPSAASLRAMAAPRPCAPPVMNAFLPATRPAMVSSFGV